jgi:hypothetical protein
MTYRWKVGKMFLLGHSRKGQSVEVSLDTFGRLNFWNRPGENIAVQLYPSEIRKLRTLLNDLSESERAAKGARA